MLDGRDRAEDWESFSGDWNCIFLSLILSIPTTSAVVRNFTFFCFPSRLSELNDLDIGEAEGSLSSLSLSVPNRDFVIRWRLPLLPGRFSVVILSI